MEAYKALLVTLLESPMKALYCNAHKENSPIKIWYMITDTPEIPKPAPPWSQHRAQIGVFGFFPIFKKIVVCQICACYPHVLRSDSWGWRQTCVTHLFCVYSCVSGRQKTQRLLSWAPLMKLRNNAISQTALGVCQVQCMCVKHSVYPTTLTLMSGTLPENAATHVTLTMRNTHDALQSCNTLTGLGRLSLSTNNFSNAQALNNDGVKLFCVTFLKVFRSPPCVATILGPEVLAFFFPFNLQWIGASYFTELNENIYTKIWIKSYRTMIYNFASHHTRDRHVGFHSHTKIQQNVQELFM